MDFLEGSERQKSARFDPEAARRRSLWRLARNALKLTLMFSALLRRQLAVPTHAKAVGMAASKQEKPPLV
jgi:hypothetical protein